MHQIFVRDLGIIHPHVSVEEDRKILEKCIVSGEINLHFYRRHPPAISIGHGENTEESVELDECEKAGVVIIQRESAGSAIYTDRDTLEYAIALPQHLVPFNREESYAFLCSAIVNALRAFEYPVEFKPVNDIQMWGRKISGSAQKRTRNCVLQHGTILLRVDYVAIDRFLKISRKLMEKGLQKHSERVIGLFEHHEVPVEALVKKVAEEFGQLLSGSLYWVNP
jgi:lipoate-protein ligase A